MPRKAVAKKVLERNKKVHVTTGLHGRVRKTATMLNHD